MADEVFFRMTEIDKIYPLEGESVHALKKVSLSIEEQFSLFYQEQQDELLDGDQEELVRIILEQQARQSGDYISDVKSVPRDDSQELLEHLLRAMGEGNE